MPGKAKKSGLDVGYLRTATSSTLASSILATRVQETEQRLVHEKQPQQIDLAYLLNNPYQPRVAMDDESLQQLADTISSQGFQGVLIARAHPERSGFYQITAGHRRKEAARRAGLKTLPVIVHSWTDQEMATLAATENIQRDDLSPLEEGRLFQTMIDEMHLTQVEVASAIKKDRGYVRNRLRLAKAPEDIQAFISTKADSMRAVIYLLDIEDPAERAPIIDQLLKRTLTTEDLPAYLNELRQRKSAPPTPLPEPQFTPAPSALDDNFATQPSTPTPPREMSQERVRQTKLKTVLRYLTEYQRLLAQQPERSAAEYSLLGLISDIVASLNEDFPP